MAPRGFFAASMGVVTLCFAAPWLACELPPAMDLPAHLALVEVMHHLDDPPHLLAQTFSWGTFPAPNSLFYGLSFLLAHVFDLKVVGQILFALALCALPWGFATYAAAMGRSRWVALASFPLAVQWPLIEGFLDYWLSLPMVLVGFALLRREIDQPNARRAAALALMSALLFLTHIQGTLYFGIGVVVMLGLALKGRKTTPRRVLQLVGLTLGPAFVLGLVWWVRAQSDLVDILTYIPTGTLPFSVAFEQVRSSTLWVQPRSTGVVLVLGGCLLAATIIAVSLGKSTAPRAPDWDRPFVPILILILVAMYFLAPMNVGHYWNLSRRALSFAVVLSALVLPINHLGTRMAPRIVLVVLLLTPTVFAGAASVPALQRWRQYTTGLVQVLEEAPKQTRLLYYAERRTPTGFYPWVWRHLGHYHTVLNGGILPFSFALQPGRVVRDRRSRVGTFDIASPDHIRDIDADRFDLVLQVGPTNLEEAGRLKVIDREGLWALYEVTATTN